MPKENLSRHSVQNLGAWRCQLSEASSPFFRGDVSDVLASVDDLAVGAVKLDEKESGVPEAVQLQEDQASAGNSKHAPNIKLCHKSININYGDTFAVSFKSNL